MRKFIQDCPNVSSWLPPVSAQEAIDDNTRRVLKNSTSVLGNSFAGIGFASSALKVCLGSPSKFVRNRLL
jgi:hypothetical protein